MSRRDSTSTVVLITQEAKQKLDLYIEIAHGEISGLGKVDISDGMIVVTDVFLLEQEASSSTTDLSQEAVAKFLVELLEAGGDPNGIRLWWHSHASMSVFWSGTDDTTIDGFSNEWMVSIVGNKKREYEARVDFYQPFRATVNDTELILGAAEDGDLRSQIAEEVKEKVKRDNTYSYTKYTTSRQDTLVDYLDRRGVATEAWRDIEEPVELEDVKRDELETVLLENGVGIDDIDELVYQIEQRRMEGDGFLETS